MIPRLYVPVLEPEDVVRHLGKQEEHWKEGRSAQALATAWFESNAFPPSIESVLRSNPVFQSAELIDAFMEREVDLGSKGRPSQTDLLAIAGISDERLAIVAVEGKAGETFGERVAEWLDGSDGKQARLKGLCAILDLKEGRAKPLRYQLLHRTASAKRSVIEQIWRCCSFTASVKTRKGLKTSASSYRSLGFRSQASES
jgi:hypothetical protein